MCENILSWPQKQSLVQDHHSPLIRPSSSVMRLRRSSQTNEEYMSYKVNWTIDANRWELLCLHPDPAVVPIVRKFYANGKERDGFRVFVRGKWVAFDRTTINGYYELLDLADDQYQALLESDTTN